LPRAKFFQWINCWNKYIKGSKPETGTDSQRWMHARAYLVAQMESERAVETFIAKHRCYFLDSFVQGFAPRSCWPWEPSVDEFDDWFEVQRVSWGPWDLGQGDVSRIKDTVSAIASES
jgi:hypothetical protein